MATRTGGQRGWRAPCALGRALGELRRGWNRCQPRISGCFGALNGLLGRRAVSKMEESDVTSRACVCVLIRHNSFGVKNPDIRMYTKVVGKLNC